MSINASSNVFLSLSRKRICGSTEGSSKNESAYRLIGSSALIEGVFRWASVKTLIGSNEA
jgi:hypothetical protein